MKDINFKLPEMDHYFIYAHNRGAGGRWSVLCEADKETTKMIPKEAHESAQRMVNFGLTMGKRVRINGKELF